MTLPAILGRVPSVSLDPALEIPSRRQLNAEQIAAIHAPTDRNVLVISGAGTGKTTVISERTGHLLSLGCPASRIISLAFNNTAADEIIERTRQVTGIDIPMIGTFHSLAQRLLRKIAAHAGLLPNFKLADARDRAAALRQAMTDADAWNTVDYDSTKFRIERWKDGLVTPEQAHRLALNEINEGDRPNGLVMSVAATAYERYQKLLNEANLIDFGDMIMLPVLALEANPLLRSAWAAKFSHILVDEFQDINDAQYRFISALASEGARKFAVGDDQQSIYGWRAARIEHIRNFQSDHPDTVQVILFRNYRSTPEIIAAANRIIAKDSGIITDKKLLATRVTGPKPAEIACEDAEREAEFILDQVRELLAKGANPSDIAVLSRANRGLRHVEDRLRIAEMPYFVASGSFWNRDEVQDIIFFLAAAADPGNDAAFLRIIERLAKIPQSGLTMPAARILQNQARARRVPLQHDDAIEAVTGRYGTDLRVFSAKLRSWGRLLSKGTSLAAVAAMMLHETNYLEYWRRREDASSAAERSENVLELIDAIRGVTDLNSLLSLTCSKHGADKSGIQLSSIHRAKGLEWRYVFVIACEQGILPHAMSTEPHQKEEERRLFYVAITRARDLLWLTWAANRQNRLTFASPYLSEVADLTDRTVLGEVTHDRADDARPSWAIFFDLKEPYSLAAVKDAFRTKLKLVHIDSGGNSAQMAPLVAAYEEAKTYFGVK